MNMVAITAIVFILLMSQSAGKSTHLHADLSMVSVPELLLSSENSRLLTRLRSAAVLSCSHVCESGGLVFDG